MPRPWETDELIATVGLTEQAGQRVRRLSGGQRRRLDVAIGIVGRPELLFLDEPTAGFDPEARREFHDLVHRLADREDATIMLTTHDLDEAEKLASVEIGHSWRHLATFGVLTAWAAAGLLVAPILLRRAARRESGSSVAARREKVLRQVAG